VAIVNPKQAPRLAAPKTMSVCDML
jgi:hypothetical protein